MRLERYDKVGDYTEEIYIIYTTIFRSGHTLSFVLQNSTTFLLSEINEGRNTCITNFR